MERHSDFHSWVSFSPSPVIIFVKFRLIINGIFSVLIKYYPQKISISSLPKNIVMSHKTNESLISTLNNCATVCNHCISACLEEEDVKMLANCIKLDIDCAQICSLTAGFFARGSAHAPHLLPECADICNACADECEKHAHMEHCKECAEACRKCAAECLQSEHA